MKKYTELVMQHKARKYQKQWLYNSINEDFTFLLGARQIGKSWIIALIACVLAHGVKKSNGEVVAPQDILVMSKDQKSAKNIIKLIRQHLHAAEKIEGKRLIHPRLGGITDVVLLNGMTILSLPGTPRTLQGFTGTVIVDEVSANKFDQEELLGQAISCSSAKKDYKVIFVSNADVQGSFVHKFFNSQDFEWKLRRKDFYLSNTTIYDAYDGELPDHIYKRKSIISDKIWKRFYENEFLGHGFGIIDKKDIERYITGINLKITGPVFMGVDPGFASEGNPTGVVIATIDSNKIKVIYNCLWQGKSLEYVKDNIVSLIKQFRVTKVFIDQGTVGWNLVQALKSIPGLCNITPVSAGQAKQETCWHIIENLLFSNNIVFAQEDPNILIDDICSAIWDDRGRLYIPERSYENGQKGKIHADSLLAFMYIIEEMGRLINKNNNSSEIFNINSSIRGI